MALDKAGLYSALLSVFSGENTPEEAAEGISNAIDTFVKTGTVPAGIVVSTPDTINGTTTTPGTIV